MKSGRRKAPHEHLCVYCTGRVRDRIRKREIVLVPAVGPVAMENVPIGVCDRCHARYYDASVLKQAEACARNPRGRTLKVPVGEYVETP